MVLTALPILAVCLAEALDGCGNIHRGGWLLIFAGGLLLLALGGGLLAWRRSAVVLSGCKRRWKSFAETALAAGEGGSLVGERA